MKKVFPVEQSVEFRVSLVFFHIMGKFLLTAMGGTEDYKTRLKKYHLQFRKIF